MPTNGRGNFMRAAMVWAWPDAGAMQHVYTGGPVPDWVATVPVTMDRPAWIPASARATLLGGDETAYTWQDTHPLNGDGR